MNALPLVLFLALFVGDTGNLLFPVTGRFAQPAESVAQPPEQLRNVYFVAFSAPWCAPCRRWRDTELPQLRAAGYSVRTIDIEKESTWNARYSVSAIPVFVMLDMQTRETVGGPWRGFTAASVMLTAAKQYQRK